ARLRTELGRVLPDYMVPSAIVVLETMPLSPNGKVDRKALPALQFRTSKEVVGLAPMPRTTIEAQLLEIWTQVLGHEEIAITDNFFDVGGTSLDALQVVSLAAKEGIPNLTVQFIFAQPVLADLAATLTGGNVPYPPYLLPMNSIAGPRTLFAIHPAFGLVADYRLMARRLEGQFNVFGLTTPFYTSPDWDPKTLEEMANDYVQAVRTVQPHGPYHFVGWSMGGVIALNMAYQLRAMGEEVAFVGMVDCFVPASIPDDPHNEEPDDRMLERLGEVDAQYWRKFHAVGRKLKDISMTHVPKSEAVNLKLWWAKDSPLGDPQPHTETWREQTRGEVEVVRVIDADHMRIIKHPDLLDSVYEALLRLDKPMS
ncbi:alpha/beta fold hydrolase, partial [Paraburkholderia sp. BCC1885]|uniref:alpha/beta fold hydrolase n=1 Tax=Paraburkholderia sp. BCC1885 TaxID=2562669 RepID=UPI0021B46F61